MNSSIDGSINNIFNNIGILDPEGKNLNPLTGEPYSETYKELAKIWSNFPTYQRANEIIKDIVNNQILLVISATGSGKTVLIPKFVLHILNYQGRVGVTLPKQIITKSTAEFSAKTLDVKLGEEVGYQYRRSPKNSRSKNTKLLYATDGTIKAMLLNDPYLREFDAIIIDEAHERKIQIDFLFYLLRNTLRLRPEFKLIIMSATINGEIFESYFSEFKYKEISISGQRLYPIKSYFLPKSLEYKELIMEGFNILIDILKKDDPLLEGSHDILFFITTRREALNFCKMLDNVIQKEKQNNDNNNKQCSITCTGDVICIEVFSGMDETRQNLAQSKDSYRSQNNYNRKVVISTNVAESSITIDGIKYVIDSGHELKNLYNPIYRGRQLKLKLISHAQALQRMGRAGRTEPGIAYHLYTEDDFENNMEKFPEPDIRTNDITNDCLQLLNTSGVETVDKLLNILTNLIEPPRENYITVALDNLIKLNAISNNTITPLGQLMANLPFNDPMVSYTLIMGKLYNCWEQLLKIYSIIDLIRGNLIDIFMVPMVNQIDENKEKDYLVRKFNTARGKFIHKLGDHLSILNIYDSYVKKKKLFENDTSKLYQWSYENFLKSDLLDKAIKQYKKYKYQINNLIKDIDYIDLELGYNKNVDRLKLNDRIIYCIVQGFKLNTARLNKQTNLYKTKYSQNLNIKISNSSFLQFLNKQFNDVVYHELFLQDNQGDLNIVSRISSNILKLL